MMNCLDLFSVDTKTLLSLSPVALGVLLLFYNIKSSKEENVEGAALEYPPVAPVGTIQFMRARVLPDFPLQSLAWCRQMTSPVYRIKTLFFDVVLTNDVHLIRQVFQDKDATKPTTYNIVKVAHNGGDDILTSNGAFWKHSRKAMSKAFSSSHLKLMTKTVKRITENFIEFRLDPMAEKGESIDIGKELIDLTMTIISEAAFEYDMSDDEKEAITNGFTLTLREGTKCFVFPLRSRFGKFLFPESKEAQLASMRLIEVGTNILESYRAMDNPTKGTAIDLIAQNTSYKTDKERVSDILMLLYAGHDTTSLSLTWILLELAKKPHEQRLLRNELRSHPEEDRSNSTMLRNVIKEGMRLHPVAAVIERIVNKDIIYRREGHSKGLLIPKGSHVSCHNFILCRNEKYFKDPDEFIPSRWEDASEDAIAASMPFAIGRRNCVGQSLAMIELRCVLARLCTDYDFSVVEEGVPTFGAIWKPVGTRLVAKKVH